MNTHQLIWICLFSFSAPLSFSREIPTVKRRRENCSEAKHENFLLNFSAQFPYLLRLRSNTPIASLMTTNTDHQNGKWQYVENRLIRKDDNGDIDHTQRTEHHIFDLSCYCSTQNDHNQFWFSNTATGELIRWMTSYCCCIFRCFKMKRTLPPTMSCVCRSFDAVNDENRLVVCIRLNR